MRMKGRWPAGKAHGPASCEPRISSIPNWIEQVVTLGCIIMNLLLSSRRTPVLRGSFVGLRSLERKRKLPTSTKQGDGKPNSYRELCWRMQNKNGTNDCQDDVLVISWANNAAADTFGPGSRGVLQAPFGCQCTREAARRIRMTNFLISPVMGAQTLRRARSKSYGSYFEYTQVADRCQCLRTNRHVQPIACHSARRARSRKAHAGAIWPSAASSVLRAGAGMARAICASNAARLYAR